MTFPAPGLDDLRGRITATRWPERETVSAISVFPGELGQAPRSWAERAYPHNLIHYCRLGRGGHFAAWEQPQSCSEEMRASFRALRS